MARLPIVGEDQDTWGTVLNEYLEVSHTSGGTLKDNTVSTNTLQNGAVSTSKLDSANSPGNGQTLSYNGTKFAWITPTTGQSVAVKDESTTLTSAASSLTFAGTGVTATNTGSDVTVTIPSSALDSADYIISKTGSTYFGTSSADGSQLASGADAGAVLTAAINALGTGGGTIAFKPGVYTWSSIPALPANLTGWLRIIGQQTTISLTTGGNRFLDFNKQANGDTFRFLQVENFTVDAAALSSVGGTQHIIIGTFRPSDGVTSGTDVNFEYITLKNLRSLNVRVANSSTAHHLNIFLGLHQSASGLPENHMEHILVEDCEFDGGNHGLTIYGNKSGAWSGNPTIWLDDIVIRHIRHDMRSASTGFDATSHVHVSSLGYGGDVLIEDVWGYGSRDVGVEVDTMMNARIENVVVENYYGFAVALTNYNNPPEYRSQHVYVRNAVGFRDGGVAGPSSSSVVGIRTTTGFPNGHFTLENIKHYRAATAPDLSTSPLAGDLVSVKGSVESLTINGGHYEAIGATLSGSGSQAAQIIYIDDLTSTRTRITIDNLDIRFRGAKAGGATATIALFGVQFNGSVDIDVKNVRMYVDFPNIEQVNAIDLGTANGGTMRGEIDTVKMFGPNLGSNPKGVFVPGSSTVTIPYSGALRIRNVDPDALPAGADIFVGDATNKALVDIGLQPLAAAVKTVTADYSIASSDGIILVNSAGTVTVSLPSGTTSGAGKEFVVKSIGAGTTFVNALGGNIDGVAQITLSGPTTFVSDGTNWHTVSPAASGQAISYFARTVTANYSLTASDGVVFANGTGITLSLPSGTGSGAGKQFIVKNIGTDNVAVNALGGTIEGGASVTLLPGMSTTYVSDGTNWIALSKLGGEAFAKASRTVTANYTLTATDGVVFANGTGITLSLPSGTGSGAGKQFIVKNIGTDNVAVNSLGGTIEGGASVTLQPGICIIYISDGTNWIALSKLGNDALTKAATTVTSNYSVASTDGSIFTNGAGITVSLPSGTNSGGGKQFLIKNIGASTVEVNSLGGNVNGTGQITLAVGASSTFTSDGTNWWGSV